MNPISTQDNSITEKDQQTLMVEYFGIPLPSTIPQVTAVVTQPISLHQTNLFTFL